jgi:threonylcarbamoyladenosine tRNA methylthiotransferase MtaB
MVGDADQRRRALKVSVVNLGCKVNQSEGEDLLSEFAAAGYEKAGRGDAADIIVVNTCTVTGEADRKSRKAIYRACEVASSTAAQSPRNDVKRPVVVVTGCYAGVAADELRKIEGVTVVVPQGDKGNLVETVLGLSEIASSAKNRPPRNDVQRSGSRVRGFLKIQDGCDNRCSYCIVPDARGNPVSIPTASVLQSAEALVKSGAAEIVLTGVNIGKFRNSDVSREPRAASLEADSGFAESDLTNLVRRLLKVPGIMRVRISSIEPEDIGLDLINLMRPASRLAPNGSRLTEAYLCPHLHIPLQSGDRRVLQRMGRRYTPSDFLRLCNTIRAACPDAAITTDVIVGFPGETDQEFANTMTLLQQSKPSRIHVFKYSRRTGTPAADMPDQVPDNVKSERSEAVRALGDRLAAEYRASFAGKELDVLVEREKDGVVFGTTENYLTMSMPGSKDSIGKIIRYKL